MKKRALVVTGLVIVIAVITSVAFLNTETRVLRRRIAAGDVGWVNGFVDDNISRPQEQDIVLSALRLAFDAHVDGIVLHFEELLTDGKFAGELEDKVLGEFAIRRQAFANPSALFEAMLNHPENPTLMLDVLRLTSAADRRALVLASLPVPNSLTEMYHTRVKERFRLASATVPEFQGKFDNMLAWEDQRFSAGAKAIELQIRFNSNQGKIDSSLPSLSKQLFQLSGYVVAEHSEFKKALDQAGSYGGSVYEIAPTESTKHALLLTSRTKFEYLSSFSMMVEDMGESPVILKEEYGGFNQTIKLYGECNASCLQQRDDLTKKVDGLRQENAALRVQIASLTQTEIDAVQNLKGAICALRGDCGSTKLQGSSAFPPQSH
jgi:hypothetical protein